MWSILTDPLPDVISVNGVIFGVRTDFRVWLRVGQLLSDAGSEIKQDLLQKLFDLVVPADGKPDGYILGSDFIAALAEFYAGPRKDDADPEEPEPGKPKAPRSFDFGWDAGLIYQSFASFYHIRLTETRMHWWEFLTLFNGFMLNDGNSLNFVMGVRQKKLNDVPKAQRAAYGKMKKEFAIPKPETLRQTENAVYDMLEAMWAENEKTEEHDVGQSDHQD